MGKTALSSQEGLERSLNLIEYLATSGASMTALEISKMFNITRTTAYSLLNALFMKRYLEKDEETGKYSIGYRIYDLGTNYCHKYPFLYVAEKYIVKMSEKWNIKMNVCVLKQPGVAIVVLSKDTSLIPKMIFGYVMQAYSSASGKLLLSELSFEKIEEYFSETDFKKYTINTLTSKQQLYDEFHKIRSQGYSVEYEEQKLNRCCIASPIRNISGQIVATISFSCSKNFLDLNFLDLQKDITNIGEAISVEMGFNYTNFMQNKEIDSDTYYKEKKEVVSE